MEVTMKLKTMSVTDLNAYIKRNFDHDFILNNLTVLGEISNFKAHSSGHLYFSLKDEHAKVNCVMFRQDAATLAKNPKDGMKVLLSGRVSVYAKEGTYQLYVNKMEEVGLGEIYQEFEENKEKLQKEGLFRAERKKPLPPYPERVAVITSGTGAAVQDIINVSRRRNNTIELLIFPTLVQGETARKAILDTLRKVNLRDDIDVIILARGGGSFEDLSCFNDLSLAYEIASSKVPVVTGIGHEVDFTIADFVADYRGATPSQAAEIVIPSLSEALRSLQDQVSRLDKAYSSKIRYEKTLFMALQDRLFKNHPNTILVNSYLEIEQKRNRLDGIIMQRMERERDKLESFYSLLQAHNPLNILDKGYALIFDEKKHLIRTSDELRRNKTLSVRMRDGEVKVEVSAYAEESEKL
jgi:exodeoxyribonuclease VII large subunit